MSNSSEIPPLNSAALLHQYGLRPNKSLGQNFLQDPAALERIVSAAGIEPDDSVLEVGPGLGNLTRYLAVHAREVIAVELDQRLLPPLQAVLSPYSNVRLVQADILKVSPAELMSKDGYLVVANIPYYITSAILRQGEQHTTTAPDGTDSAKGSRGAHLRRIWTDEFAFPECASLRATEDRRADSSRGFLPYT